MGNTKQSFAMRKPKLVLIAAVFATVGVASMAALGCTSPEAQDAGTVQSVVDGNGKVEVYQGDDRWAAYQPEVITRENGVKVQKTPLGPSFFTDPTNPESANLYSADWNLYNTDILDADNRGCSSCHDMEATLKAIHHGVLFVGNYYHDDMEYTSSSSCNLCHSQYYGFDIKNFAHSHMSKQTFRDMGGSCLSCHYINDETGDFEIWGDVRYNVMSGITDLSTEEVTPNITWNQDKVITDPEKMFFNTGYHMDYTPGLVEESDDIRNTYTVSFTGELENPCEMTIQEMIDQFGSETRTQVEQCVINGTGGQYIYQAEITGIPLKKVMEYIKPTDQANIAMGVSLNAYATPAFIETYEDALMVYEINGQPLTQQEGYPLQLWMSAGTGASANTRYLSEMTFVHYTDEEIAEGFTLDGQTATWMYNPKTGLSYSAPNIGVLSAETGTIFPAGQPVHLEGYSHSFQWPVTMIKFSLDHGATWTEVPIENMDPNRWVYWEMDLDLEPGSYVLEMGAASVDPDGVVHDEIQNPQFLINVQ